MSPIGSPLGLINVTVGQSSAPPVEADVLSDVASYGKQLGRIEDALTVLLAHFRPATPLTEEESAAIDDLNEMLQQIANVKAKHKRKAMRPSPPHHTSTQEPHTPIASPPAPELIASPALPPPAAAPTRNSSDPAPAAASRRPSRGPPRRSA
jgi:hypothetical protein